jgi:protoporphyrinogen oxidase
VVFEGEETLGGLASTFRLEGHHLERYYHFICRGDRPFLRLLKELGLHRDVHWAHTTMGLVYHRRLYPFGQPWDLLTFPALNWRDKFRFGWGVLRSKSIDDWHDMENVPAARWLTQRFGSRAYAVVHEPLLKLKFGPYADRISAAWMWARIHRLAHSRTGLLQREMLGYLDGGTQRLVDRLAQEITNRGGRILTKSSVSRILASEGRVKGVECAGRSWEFDQVLSTMAAPGLAKCTEGIPGTPAQKHGDVEWMGVVCLVLRLKTPLSRHFWVNISDPIIPLAGVIEFTNLNPCPYLDGDSIAYVPRYVPSADDTYSMESDDHYRQIVEYLKLLFPAFSDEQVREYRLFRDEYAQPICEMGFTQTVPAMKTPIAGLYAVDSSQLHPHDRTVSDSTNLGYKAARLLMRESTEDYRPV